MRTAYPRKPADLQTVEEHFAILLSMCPVRRVLTPGPFQVFHAHAPAYTVQLLTLYQHRATKQFS